MTDPTPDPDLQRIVEAMAPEGTDPPFEPYQTESGAWVMTEEQEDFLMLLRDYGEA